MQEEITKTEEVIDNNWSIAFDDGKGTIKKVAIKNEDMPKLAEAFYKFCIKNKINAEITDGSTTSNIS